MQFFFLKNQKNSTGIWLSLQINQNLQFCESAGLFLQIFRTFDNDT